MKNRTLGKFMLVFIGLGLVGAQTAQAQNNVYTPVSDCGCSAAATAQTYAQPTYDFASPCASGNCGAPARDGLFSDLNIGGWFQFGYHSESNDLFNSRPDALNLHQAWLFVEKEAVSENGELAFGFRVDGVYGIDGPDTQSFGNAGNTFDLNPSFTRGSQFGWAIPQLYGEIAKGDWSVKIGHFYTLVGYEVVTAPDNFFYSHAITTFNTEPFTHTGAVATYNLNDDTTLYGGWTAGWDTGFDFGTGSSFLGGISRQLNDDAALTYITTIGDLGLRSNGENGYSHSIVLDTNLTERLQYVIQSDLLRVDGTGEDNVGLVQNLIFNATDRVGFGTRFEWWKGDDITGYAPHGGLAPTSSTSYYAATFGMNYKFTENLRIRPEYRFDWSPALGYDVGYVGIDLIGTF